uniref:Glutamine amidotransferase type-2 domain-containing protein n=1 Tax=Mycena chlorophos TaxID=658473 RepID=A0ABQ0M2P9_MYCCL|nr:predicted protein [Mycena chlorophos]
MCRFVIYKGTSPVQLSHLLTRPTHSIINQAFDSRLRLDRRRPMNGDGFGVGWYDTVYDEELGPQPCIFTSVTPAWNNINLQRLAEKIKSPLVFGHVRATTAGSLSLDNCHPFKYGKLMFMHNGGIAQWELIKRQVQKDLPDFAFNMAQGNTDSEWAFAVFLSKLPDADARVFTPEILRKAMLDTIAALNSYADAVNITEPSLMNFCVTDGDTVVATRYISSDKDEAASLWFSSGTTFSEDTEGGGGHYRMSKADKRENIIMVASEPLTFERADWMEIRTNTMVVITPRFNVLQIPIIDKHSAPASAVRGTDFAHEKGFLNPRTALASLPPRHSFDFLPASNMPKTQRLSHSPQRHNPIFRLLSKVKSRQLARANYQIAVRHGRASPDPVVDTPSPVKPAPALARVALQNEDDETDAVVITALSTLPFCCHEDLLTMARPALIAVAEQMNEKLPKALRISIGRARSDAAIRNEIEFIVGLRKEKVAEENTNANANNDTMRTPPTSPSPYPVSPRSPRSRAAKLRAFGTPGTPILERLAEEDEDDMPTKPNVDVASEPTQSERQKGYTDPETPRRQLFFAVRRDQ